MINKNEGEIELQNINQKNSFSNSNRSNLNQSNSEISSDSKSQIKLDKSRISELKQIKKIKKFILVRNGKYKVIAILPMLIMTVIMTYLIKPLLFVIKLYFLSSMLYANTINPTFNPEPSDSIWVILVGYLIVFVLPLFHLFTEIRFIFTVEQHIVLKIYTGIIIIIELIVELPLTFLLPNKYLSVFLFTTKNLGVYTASNIIFFPTDFMLHIFEISRQTVDSVFFIVFCSRKIYNMKNNRYFIFQKQMLILFLTFCSLQFLHNIFVLVFKLLYGISNYHFGSKHKTQNNIDNDKEKN